MDSQAEEDSQQEQEQHEGEQFGFKPMEEPVEDEKKKRAREESEESKALKKEIVRIIARYPQLILRTSKQIMDKLNEMGEDELRIVRDNCLNDLVEIRGSPASSFVLFCITRPVDAYLLPGYTDQCLSDTELQRDVETEMIALLGELSNRINIFFRLINNAYITWKKNRGETFPDINAARPQPKSDGEDVDPNKRKGGEEGTEAFRTNSINESPW